MPFRFYRRKRLFPGVSLNLSRSGLSFSLGLRGAKVTIGPRGIRKTVGIPGTGLFYTESEKYRGPEASGSGTRISLGRILLCIVLAIVALVILARMIR